MTPDDWTELAEAENDEVTPLRAKELAVSEKCLQEHLQRIQARRDAWQYHLHRKKQMAKRISDAEVDEWGLMQASGMDVKAIAEQSGVSFGSVYEHLRRRAQENRGE